MATSRSVLPSDPDSSMSRLYYALYQAAMHALETKGKTPSMLSADDKQWSHTLIRQNASLCRGRRDDGRLFSLAFTLRQRADYHAEGVDDSEVRNLTPQIEAFLKETCA